MTKQGGSQTTDRGGESESALAGLPDREAIRDRLGSALAYAGRVRASIAFVIISIAEMGDGGHAEGILAEIAGRVRAALRSSDAIGHYSPDALALVLMDCDEEQLAIAADRFRRAITAECIPTGAGPVTVSVRIGGVVAPRQARSVAAAIAQAEEAAGLARGAQAE